MVREVVKRAAAYALLTGGDSVVAQALASELLGTGWHVILTAHGATACDRIKRQLLQDIKDSNCAQRLIMYDVDPGHISSVRSFADIIIGKRLYLRLLVLCGGHDFHEPGHHTDDSLEFSFGVSFVMNFLVTLSLLPEMRRAGTGLVLCLLPSSPHRLRQGYLGSSAPQVDLHMVREQTEAFSSRHGLLQIKIVEALGLADYFDTTSTTGVCNAFVRVSVVLTREGDADEEDGSHHACENAHHELMVQTTPLHKNAPPVKISFNSDMTFRLKHLPTERLMMEFRVMHRDVRPPPEGHADRVMGCLQLPFEALTAAPSGTHSYARDAFVLGPERDTSMDPYLVRGGMGRGGNMGGANYSASACHSVQDCLDAYPDEVQVCIRHGLCWSDQQGRVLGGSAKTHSLLQKAANWGNSWLAFPSKSLKRDNKNAVIIVLDPKAKRLRIEQKESMTRRMKAREVLEVLRDNKDACALTLTLVHLADPHHTSASGLKWQLMGDASQGYVPRGKLLTKFNVSPGKELATFTKALNSKTEFTNKEWDAFGINDLHTEHYIQADNGLFYQPANATDEHIQPIRVAFSHKTVADVFYGILAPHTASQPQIVPGSHCALIVYSVVSYWHSKGGMKAHRLIIDLKHGALLQQAYGDDDDEDSGDEGEHSDFSLTPVIHFWQIAQLFEHSVRGVQQGEMGQVRSHRKQVANGLTLIGIEGQGEWMVEFIGSSQRAAFVRTMLPFLPARITGQLKVEVTLQHANVPHIDPHMSFSAGAHVLPMASDHAPRVLEKAELEVLGGPDVNAIINKWTKHATIQIPPPIVTPGKWKRADASRWQPAGSHWSEWSRSQLNVHATACMTLFMSELSRRLDIAAYRDIKVATVDVGEYRLFAKFRPPAGKSKTLACLTCGLVGGRQKLPPPSRYAPGQIAKLLLQELALGQRTPELAMADALRDGRSIKQAQAARDQARQVMAVGGGLAVFEGALQQRHADRQHWQAMLNSSKSGQLRVNLVDSLAHTQPLRTKQDRSGVAQSPATDAETRELATCARLWHATSVMLKVDLDLANPLRSTILNVLDDP